MSNSNRKSNSFRQTGKSRSTSSYAHVTRVGSSSGLSSHQKSPSSDNPTRSTVIATPSRPFTVKNHSGSHLSLTSLVGPTADSVYGSIANASNPSIFQMDSFSASSGRRRHSSGPQNHQKQGEKLHSGPTSQTPSISYKKDRPHSNRQTDLRTNNQYLLEGPLNALSNSPDREHVAVVGRDVFKILQVPQTPSSANSMSPIREAFNFRLGASLKMNATINDVKWSQSASNTLLTCGTDGVITIWDMNKSTPDKIDRMLMDHRRATNRICFHPSDGNVFLSASQDGTVKLWDMRTKGLSKSTFEGKAESVRDVIFNPIVPFEFASAYENGNIQLWDIRSTTQCKRKWNAHNGLTLSLDWSTDGRFIASGGRDRFVKLWDTKSDARKPTHSIQTISPVALVRWKLGHNTQLAYASLSSDFRIHVWDYRRPYVSQLWLEDHDNVVTGFLWHSPDTIWSCSKDRNFSVQHVWNGTAPLSYLSSSAVAWNPTGHVSYALKYRESVLPLTFQSSSPTDMSGKSFNSDTGTSIPPSYVSQATSTFTNFSSSTKNIHPSSLIRKGVEGTDTVTAETDLEKFKPFQILSAFDFEAFHTKPETFALLANELQLDSSDVDKSCFLNAQLCEKMGLESISNIWKMIQVLFGKEAVVPRNLSEWYKENVSSRYHSSETAAADKHSLSQSISTPFSFDDREAVQNETTDQKLQLKQGERSENESLDSDQSDLENDENEQDDVPDEEDDIEEEADGYENAASLDSNSEESDLSSDDSDSPKLGTLKPIRRTERTALGRKYAFMSSILQRVPMLKVKPTRPTRPRKSVFKVKAVPVMTRTLNRDLIMERIYNFLCDQGDMQTCVSISFILKDNLKIPIDRITECFYSYIDLLCRHELPTEAAKIIGMSHIESIQAMNQQSTLIHTMCGVCQKPIDGSVSVNVTGKPYWVCETCKKPAVVCSLCRKPVKGMMVWCHGCAHGGHVECMNRWYEESLDCPSGCGHVCLTRKLDDSKRLTPAASVLTI